MSANKIAETSTSTGTGDFTLDGAWSIADSFVTGNRTFNSFYGLNHRFPYIIQDKNGNWEKGRGYLSGAAVLVREAVIDNSLSTTALVDFPAGEKLVMVPTDAGSYALDVMCDYGFGYVGTALNGSGASNFTYANNTARFTSLTLDRPMLVTDTCVNIVSNIAGSSLLLGLYQLKSAVFNLTTISKVADFGTIDVSTSGLKVNSVSHIKLGAGTYLLASRPSVASIICAGITEGMDIGVGTSISVTGFLWTSGTGLPDEVSLNQFTPVNTVSPRIGVRGKFL